MAIFSILCSILIIGPSINASPVEIKDVTSYLTSLGISCTNITELIKNQKQAFDNCQDFKDINNTKNFLCLMYFDQLKTYCDSKPSVEQYPTLTEVAIKNYDIESICNISYSQSALAPKGNVRIACYHFCSDGSKIVPECQWAIYFHRAVQESFTVKNLKESLNKSDNSINENAVLSTVVNKSANVASSLKSQIPEVNGNNQPLDSIKPQNTDLSQSHKENTTKVELSVSREVSEDIQNIKIGDTSEKNKKPTISEENQAITQTEEKEHNNEDLETKANNEPEKDSNIPESHQINAKDDQNIPANTVISKPKSSLKKNDEPKQNIETPSQTEPKKMSTQEVVKSDEIKQNNNVKLETPENEYEAANEEEYNGLPDVDSGVNNFNENTLPQQPHIQQEKKPDTVEAINSDNLDEIDGESYFLSYFMVICVLIVLGYVGYHNRIKVMALILEGKKNKRQYRGRRPNSANYHKLDSNLEEAISSNVTKNLNNVIY